MNRYERPPLSAEAVAAAREFITNKWVPLWTVGAIGEPSPMPGGRYLEYRHFSDALTLGAGLLAEVERLQKVEQQWLADLVTHDRNSDRRFSETMAKIRELHSTVELAVRRAVDWQAEVECLRRTSLTVDQAVKAVLSVTSIDLGAYTKDEHHSAEMVLRTALMGALEVGGAPCGEAT